MGFSAETLGSFHVNRGFGIQFYTADNGQGEYWGYANSLKNVRGIGGGKAIRSIRITRQRNAALSEDAMAYASDNDEEAIKAIDGVGSRWSGTGAPAWLMIDLGKGYTVNRYVVRHAGASGEPMGFNTRDFRFQYSVDGENWITVDTITDNTGNITDRYVTPFTARYVRLLITKPNSMTGRDAAVSTIAEFEVYGIDSGKAYGAAAEPVPVIDEDQEPEDNVYDDSSLDEKPEDDTSEPEDTSKDTKPSTLRKVIKKVVQTVLPWWGWVLIAVGCVLVAGGAVIVILLVRRKRK